MRRALTGLATLVAIGCGNPTINVVDPFAAVNWSPHDGATCVNPAWPNLAVGVCLSRDIRSASLSGNVSVHRASPDGSPTDQKVSGTVSLASGDRACIEIRDLNLDEETDYAIVVEPGLTAEDGTTLGHRLSSYFRTLDGNCS